MEMMPHKVGVLLWDSREHLGDGSGVGRGNLVGVGINRERICEISGSVFIMNASVKILEEMKVYVDVDVRSQVARM